MEETSASFSALQHLLQLSYSENPEDQQKAAIELSRLVDGTIFPAVSFGPLSHALCKLIPSSNRTVASYSAKALKILILDNALRPQAIISGNYIKNNFIEISKLFLYNLRRPFCRLQRN